MADNIAREALFPLSHYTYGEAYFGSCNGVRYRVAADPLTDVHFLAPGDRPQMKLKFSTWPEPWNYATTPEDSVEDAFFEFSEEGFTEGVKWLNQQIVRIF